MEEMMKPVEIANDAEKRIRKFFKKIHVDEIEVNWLVVWIRAEIKKAIRDERSGLHKK